MRTFHTLSLLRLILWQRRNIAILASLTTLVVIAEQLTGSVAGRLPDVPIAVLGSAIGIFVSFRTNSAYDRWWEARKLWGQLVNTSRHFCAEVVSYLGQHPACASLVLRQALYAHVLRCELSDESLQEDHDVQRTEAEAHEDLARMSTGAATALLRKQLSELASLARDGEIDGLQLSSLDRSLAILLDVQGGCERIRNTPLPPGYGYIAEMQIRAYALILPLAIADDLHWLALPVSLYVCLALKLISEVGRVLEDPFTHSWEALPLLSLCRVIERDLREALGLGAPSIPEAKPNAIVR